MSQNSLSPSSAASEWAICLTSQMVKARPEVYVFTASPNSEIILLSILVSSPRWPLAFAHPSPHQLSPNKAALHLGMHKARSALSAPRNLRHHLFKVLPRMPGRRLPTG